MPTDRTCSRLRQSRVLSLVVLGLALVIAVGSARPYAGGWNDGSRLATVETLVDQHTLCIDNSIFVHVSSVEASPYDPVLPDLARAGTSDKLFIHGHYYSDKSPVPALLMATVYRGWEAVTGWTARTHPGAFCYWMTLLSSGLAYVVAVVCMDRLGYSLGLSLPARLLLTVSFGLATVALPYARHVNNHIVLLGVVMPLMVGLHVLAERVRYGGPILWLVTGLGCLTGFGYTIDLGAGPALLVCVLPLVAWRCRRWQPVAVCLLAALPWLVLHHWVNYEVGGTIGPANAVPAYFNWPGCPFNPANMTGTFQQTPGHFFIYGGELLIGKRGFLNYNLPLFLALLGVFGLFRRDVAEWPEALFGLCWCGGVWLAYGLTSNNCSGACCSIRWFVPFLAPSYYVLALMLRRQPSYAGDLFIVTIWGIMAAALMWIQGPWMPHMMPFFWPIQAGALLTWVWFRFRRRPRKAEQLGPLAHAA